ncbi:MAG: glutathione S-transferase [Methylovulum sp.]|nr:glutathione S-transferase [Methylovulum sp.]
MTDTLPVLYSFRRCPYAIRARMAIAYADVSVTLRDVDLKHKPEHLLVISPKATVPVLQLQNGVVIDESLAIMQWALAQHDPDNWLSSPQDAYQLIEWNDGDFKYYLDRYKYADRYPEFPASHYRQQAELFLSELEQRLRSARHLCGSSFALADAAIFPFIRQFANVDNHWFEHSRYPALNIWLSRLLNSVWFNAVMGKFHATPI